MHYIGICDFPSREQALKTAEFFQGLCKERNLNRKLMVGVMMSLKTLTGEPSKWAKVWPKNEEIRSVFVEHPYAFNTLHYADFDGKSDYSHFEWAVKFGGPLLDAIQFDMIWPHPGYLIRLKDSEPDIKLILQINSFALERVKNDPRRLIHQLKTYGQALDYVLLDKSHGRGVGMDAQALLPFVEAVVDHLPMLQVGVAGGLGPKTMDLVLPIVYKFPEVSIDAQGQLRPSGSALDPIDWEMAHEYLREAVTIFSC